MGEPVRGVVVLGGGIAAWSAAAALKRRIPLLNVAVVNSGIDPNSLVDRVISTLPSIGVFHEDLGLTDSDTIWRAQSALRIGTRFKGWSQHQPDYVHAYGNYGGLTNGIAFHQLWLQSRRAAAVEPFDRFSPAAEIGRRGCISAGDSTPADPEIGYGLRLTIERYQQLMRAFALHLGVIERIAELADLRVRSEDGFIDELALADGSTIRADIFVDCSGPSALLRSRMDDQFIDWSRWLPCDRLLFAKAGAGAELDLLDRVEAFAAGWVWSGSSAAVESTGAAYSSAHSSSEQVARTITTAQATEEVSMRQGRWAQPWVRNCVAIGDAAITIEPLEWTNLHLAHNQIDRLVAMMPGRDCAAIEIAEYNRQCCAEADRVRDFICMHYVTALRDEPFWKDAAAIEMPDSLAHTLSLFAERGRLPYYEEETFTRDSWLAVLFGQGFIPRRVDPLATIFEPAEARELLTKYEQSVSSFADQLPSYREYMSNLSDRRSI